MKVYFKESKYSQNLDVSVYIFFVFSIKINTKNEFHRQRQNLTGREGKQAEKDSVNQQGEYRDATDMV